MMMSRALLVAAALAALAVQPAGAAITISPMSVRLDKPGEYKVVTLANDGETARRFQVDIAGWNQGEGCEGGCFAFSSHWRVTPPVTEIPPGGAQQVRVYYQAEEVPFPVEAAARLRFRELPVVGDPSPVQFKMSFALPVFAGGDHCNIFRSRPGDAALDIEVSEGDGSYNLVMKNMGNCAVRFANPTLVKMSDGSLVSASDSASYILPGASVNLIVPYEEKNAPACSDLSLTMRVWRGEISRTNLCP